MPHTNPSGQHVTLYNVINIVIVYNIGTDQCTIGSVVSERDTSNIKHAIVVKTAEVFDDQGKRLARYLNMKQQWRDIVQNQKSDQDDYDTVESLLFMWGNGRTEAELREILYTMDKDKAAQVFD